MINVNLPKFSKLVNPPFKGLLNNHRRIIFLWGGRGSGKSIAAIRLLIVRCLLEPYFKCILVRKVYDTIKESMFEAIKDEVETLGLTALFEFRVSPMEIRCVNGNKFICRGLDKPEKLRSIKEPSMAWYEEGNQITEEDHITVSTTLRSNKARFLQEIFSFNPETDGANVDDFWLYKQYFKGVKEKTFDGEVEVFIPSLDRYVSQTFSSIWSTYHDNKHVSDGFIATLETLKKKNPYYYGIFALGNWGNKEVLDQFYKLFSMDIVGHAEYIHTLPIHISLDENVHPYLTMTIHQVRKRDDKFKIWQIGEICLPHPNNTLKATCDEFKRRYPNHVEGLYIYGDRTSIKQDVKLEKGQNFFTMVRDELEQYRPELRLPSVNPNVKSRGAFINDLFHGEDPEVEIIIGDGCSNTIDDYINLVEDADGTKFKKKVTNKQTKVSYEQYGHTSDANDYFYCELLKSKYSAYIGGSKRVAYKSMRRSMTRGKNRI